MPACISCAFITGANVVMRIEPLRIPAAATWVPSVCRTS